MPFAYVFSHLVLASKFSLPPTLHSVKGKYVTYELTHEVAYVILDALEVVNLLD
jgi:hypothetical protein